MKITLGTKTKAELIKEVEKVANISRWTKDVLTNVTVETKKKEINIEIIKLKDWFEKDWITTKEVYDKAKEKGYSLVSAETALQFIVQNPDNGDWMVFGMEPIVVSDGDPHSLYASRGGGGLWLETAYGRSDSEWGRENGFAFASPQVGTKKSDTQPSLETLTLEKAIEIVKANGLEVYKKM